MKLTLDARASAATGHTGTKSVCKYGHRCDIDVDQQYAQPLSKSTRASNTRNILINQQVELNIELFSSSKYSIDHQGGNIVFEKR